MSGEGGVPRSARCARLLALLAFGFGACRSTSTGDVPDRFEPVNRGLFVVDGLLDTLLVKPASKVYAFVLPVPIRRGISNVLGNAFYLDTILNDFLQGKFEQGGRDLGRFALNSTAGVAGIFDVASGTGLVEHDEDFGQTLAAWGVPAGSYVVVPLFGPSTLRDLPGIAFSIFASPLPYVRNTAASATLWSLYFVEPRSEVDPDYERRAREADDPYAFVREAWLAHRSFLIHDGNPPLAQGEVEDLLQQVDELDELDALDGPNGADEPPGDER